MTKLKRSKANRRASNLPNVLPMGEEQNDLPIKMYETVSSFRYETKQTRPLIRDRR